MIDVIEDIRTLTDFKRQSTGTIQQLKNSRRPAVLTVKRKAEAVVMDISIYQRSGAGSLRSKESAGDLPKPRRVKVVLAMRYLTRSLENEPGLDHAGSRRLHPRLMSRFGNCCTGKPTEHNSSHRNTREKRQRLLAAFGVAPDLTIS
jgi:hypothetical protein